VRRETARLGELVQRMLEEFSAAVRDRDLEHITAIARRADDVAVLQAAILRYLGVLRQGELSHRESREVQELMEAAFHFESLGRLVATNLVDIARQSGHLRASAETAEMLQGLYESAIASVVSAVRAVRDADVQAAAEVASMRWQVDDQVQNLLERQATRLRPEESDYLVLARLQMSIVDELRRVYDLAARIARAVVASGAGSSPGGAESAPQRSVGI
jgi:Na+/phosphate symporter